MYSGVSCSCRKNRHKDYDLYRRNKESTAIYHSGCWVKLAQMCKQLCCGLDIYELMTTGRAIPGELCHHIVEVNDDPGQAYDIDNLVYVSARNHAKIHVIYAQSVEKKRDLQKKLKIFLKLFNGTGGG